MIAFPAGCVHVPTGSGTPPYHVCTHPLHIQALQQAERGAHRQHTPSAASLLGGTATSGRAVPPWQMDAGCVCTGCFTIVGLRGATGLPAAGKWFAHPSAPCWLGKVWAAVMSFVPNWPCCTPHPGCIQGMWRWHLESECHFPPLPVLGPLPTALACPPALACLCAGGTGKGTQGRPFSSQALHKTHWLQISLPHTGGQSLFLSLQGGVTHCQPMAQGSPTRNPSLPLAHATAELPKAEPSPGDVPGVPWEQQERR